MATGKGFIQFTGLGATLPSSGAGAPNFDDQNRPYIKLALGEEFHYQTRIITGSYENGGTSTIWEYAMATATSNAVKVEMSWERLPDGFDTSGASFAAAQDSGDITVPGTVETLDKPTAITHTDGAQMDSCDEGDLVRIKIERVAATGTDAIGDMWFYSFEVKEA